MLYRAFGQTGWQVSAIGLGTWNIGNQWGPIDEATAWDTVRTAFDCGVNLFDAAESYGTPNGLSEERLGRALAGIRHQVFVVSKIGNWGARTGQGVPKTTVDMIRLCAHASLHRLRSDWHDVLLCHEGNIADPSIYLDAFAALVEEGRLRAFGISTDSLEVLQRFNARGDCSVVEIDYSLVNLQAEAELLPYCQEHGIAVLVRGPLAKGLLSGRYTKESVFTDEIRQSFNTGESHSAPNSRPSWRKSSASPKSPRPEKPWWKKPSSTSFPIQPRQWPSPVPSQRPKPAPTPQPERNFCPLRN